MKHSTGDKPMTNKQSTELRLLYAINILTQLLETITDPEARKTIEAQIKVLRAKFDSLP